MSSVQTQIKEAHSFFMIVFGQTLGANCAIQAWKTTNQSRGFQLPTVLDAVKTHLKTEKERERGQE